MRDDFVARLMLDCIEHTCSVAMHDITPGRNVDGARHDCAAAIV